MSGCKMLRDESGVVLGLCFTERKKENIESPRQILDAAKALSLPEEVVECIRELRYRIVKDPTNGCYVMFGGQPAPCEPGAVVRGPVRRRRMITTVWAASLLFLLFGTVALIILSRYDRDPALRGIWDSIEADGSIEFHADGKFDDLGGGHGTWRWTSSRDIQVTFEVPPVTLTAALVDDDLVVDYGNGRKGFLQRRTWYSDDPGTDGVDMEGYITTLLSSDLSTTTWTLHSGGECILLRFMPGRRYVPLDGDGTPIPAEGVGMSLGKEHLYRCRGRIRTFDSLMSAYEQRGIRHSRTRLAGCTRVLDVYEFVELR